MKPLKSVLLCAAAAAGLAAAGAAQSNVASTLPHEMTQGNVSYMSGGVGQDEAAAMRKEGAHFPLTVEFVQHAKPRDEYLANIDVRIRDAHGSTELTTRSDGPFLLAKLPPGKYQITANDNGRVETRDVVIAAHQPQHVVFEW